MFDLAVPKPGVSTITKMPASERASLAALRIRGVVDRISGLLALAEQNAPIVYSPLLSGQIPPSRAGHAFNVFQKAMHGFEIVQLCALWDKPDQELAHNSIPTVHALIDDDAVVKILVRNVEGGWPDDEGDPDLLAYLKATRSEGGAKALEPLSRLRQEIPKVVGSPQFVSVKNMRDRFLAHALVETRAEKKGIVAPMKYGDEQALLRETTRIIEELYLWVTGTNFDLSDNRELQARRARALWSNCKFDVTPRT